MIQINKATGAGWNETYRKFYEESALKYPGHIARRIAVTKTKEAFGN